MQTKQKKTKFEKKLFRFINDWYMIQTNDYHRLWKTWRPIKMRKAK